jgi:antitoxin StbD
MNAPLQRVNADLAVSITDLKKNPNAVMKVAEEEAVAVLNHNKVVGYIVSAAAWEYAQDLYEDIRLADIADERRNDPVTKVDISDL